MQKKEILKQSIENRRKISCVDKEYSKENSNSHKSDIIFVTAVGVMFTMKAQAAA